MNDEINQALTRAYELVEQEKLEEAQAILKPVLANEKDNADAWWLYAHAVTDVDTARDAILNVLRIDPDYPEARELLQTLETTYPVRAPIRSIEKIGGQPPLPAIPPTLPGLPADIDTDFELDDATSEGESSRFFSPRRLAILVPILLIVIIGGLLLLLNTPATVNNTDTSTVEEQAVLPTLPITDITPIAIDTTSPVLEQTEIVTLEATETTPIPLDTDIPVATIETQATDVLMPTEEVQSSNSFDTLYAALSEFTIPRNGVEISDTVAGTTLLASICTNPGPDLRIALNDAMRILANNSAAWSAQVDAIGARMVNCGTNSTLLVITVAIEDAIAFSNSELDEDTFQARWISQ